MHENSQNSNLENSNIVLNKVSFSYSANKIEKEIPPLDIYKSFNTWKFLKF